MNNVREKIGIYPGSFDPVTLGHLDIIERSSRMFDRLIVGVLYNKSKKALFSAEERVKMIRSVTGHLCNVEVVAFEGLSVDFARSVGARVLVRGLRAVTDFEYELQMAQTNRMLSHGKIDTVFLTTSLEYAYLSSSAIKQIASFDGDITPCVPDFVAKLIYDKYREKKLSEHSDV